MQRLIMSCSFVLALFVFVPTLSARSRTEPNPFAGLFKQIERLKAKQEKIGMSKGKKKKKLSKSDEKKIAAMDKSIAKAEARLQKKVEEEKKSIEKKIVSIQNRITKAEAAGQDTALLKKQLHAQKYHLAKVEAWGKNEEPPTEEDFNSSSDSDSDE